MSGTKPGFLGALGTGDVAELPPEARTIEFGGRTFTVLTFIGDDEGGGILLLGPPGSTGAGPCEIVSRCFGAAASALVLTLDWTRATPDLVISACQQSFSQTFRQVWTKAKRALAARGKPS
jgi:hypothetical protein